jgi:selenocysteine lyase/cysteine desulfurase
MRRRTASIVQYLERGVRCLSSSGYKSIGSFHSENLAELMAASDAEYNPPPLPFSEMTEDPESADFMLDLDNWTFLNHGAFGAALATGHRRAERWRRHLEAQPLRFFDRDLLPHLAYSTRLFADFMQATNRNSVTLLQNVTAGLNSVMAGYARQYQKSSHIVLWDTSYGSVKRMAKHYCGAANVTEIPLQGQYLDRLARTSNPEMVLLQALDDSIAKAGGWKGKHPLLVLDHTTSNSALTFPIERLAARMKNEVPDSLVLVDGAHGLLAQHVSMTSMPSVDAYVSNGHKWLAAPRGVAVMVLQDDLNWKKTLQPAIISHGADETDVLSRFVWDGTRDYAAALALPNVLDHWKQKDPAKVRQELRNILRNGIQHLAEVWHPDFAHIEAWHGVVTLTNFDSSGMLSPMALVRLPLHSGEENTSEDAKRIQDYLFHKRIEVPVKCINGKLYVRVSCHVYNRTRDFETLGNAILKYP